VNLIGFPEVAIPGGGETVSFPECDPGKALRSLCMKIYILTDLEGVAGVFKFEHCSPGQPFYLRSCRLLTQEVNAAVDGALSAGATGVIVWDGHGPGGIDPELLHPEAKLISGRGQIKHVGMDTTFDAMFVVGQHAMNRVPEANLCHSYDSRHISRMLLNGKEIGELGVRTIMAGFLGVPLTLVCGDDKVCVEARELVGDVETVAVKTGLSREDALSLSPAKAREAIRAGAIRALGRLQDFRPFTVPGPYELVTEYFETDPDHPDARGWDRPVGERKVKRADDFLELAF